MNTRIFAASALTVMAMLSPLTTGAQYYFEGNDSQHGWWDDTPEVVISGPPEIVFPVQGGATFTDDFGDGRSGGRTHEGNDLKAPKMSLIVAARGGRVGFAPMDEPSYGYMLTIQGDDGYKYSYIHINNDTPGTDDGAGGPGYAYAPGISDGVTVTQGQHIAWVGDSGNAEGTVSHLHFEIRIADGSAINPYQYLNAAIKIFTYDVTAVTAGSPTINADKGIVLTSIPLSCEAGALIRLQESTSVYYCGGDGKRYVFPNANTYSTWYADFSTVKVVSRDDMAMLQLGGNVTYRPGMRLVKITTDPKVYAVDKNGTLRWMTTTALAAKYYGSAWAKSVNDVPDAFFINYKIGDPITN